MFKKRLTLEYQRDIDKYPGIYWTLSEDFDESLILNAVVEGPANTPYEGAIFRFEIQICTMYPFKMPKYKMLTPIYHPTNQKVFDPLPLSLCPHQGDVHQPTVTIS